MNLSAVNRSVSLIGRLFDVHHTTESFIPPTTGKPAFEPLNAPYFPRITPEEAGVDSRVLANMLESLAADPKLRMHAVTVLRGGRVLCEAAFGARDTSVWQYTFSACKSIVALAIGILCGEGKLSTGDKLIDLFPDRVNAVQRLRLAPLTVEDLLTMRSGIVFNEFECMTDPDWVKCFMASSVSGEIGRTFNYNSMNSYMLAAIIQKKTGMTLSEYLRQKLFGPMQITRFHWDVCPKGIERGGWGLYLLSEDMAKLGTLVLSGGIWEGKQLIPAQFIREAILPHAATPAETGPYNYGYQMWIGKSPRAFLFNGMFGQNTLGFPDTGILVVANAATDELFQNSSFYRTVTEAVGSVGEDIPLPPSDEGMQALTRVIKGLKEHTAAVDESTDIAERTALGRGAAVGRIPPVATASAPGHSPIDPPPTPAEETGPLPRWRQALSRLFAKKEGAPSRTVPQKPLPAIRPLPAWCDGVVGRTFVPLPGEPTAALGLFPMVLQAIHNNYTAGLVSLSFSKRTENGREVLYLTYTEAKDTHVLPLGTDGVSLTTQLSFSGEPFLCAARCEGTRDEDGDPVLKLVCDLIETPSTRRIKLFFRGDGTVLLRQEEDPGAALIRSAILDRKADLSAQPILGAALGAIDNDYLTYRVRRSFAPEITLQERTPHTSSGSPAAKASQST